MGLFSIQVEFPLQLSWRCGPDMPFGMSGSVQSVVVEGTYMYVGGGGTSGSNDQYTVMTYDISTRKWSTLPPYRAWSFAMTSINNQLVLVGGHGYGDSSKVLGVWDADVKQWTHPYPEMHTARSSCSAVVYDEWLVVAGGTCTSVHMVILSSVEVLNINTKRWYAGPQTSVPWYLMKTTIVGEECFFMSGYTGEKVLSATATTNVYSVSLPYLLSNLQSDERDGNIWNEISGLQTTRSTPLSISGSLLAVGGLGKDRKEVTAIRFYQPDTGEWVKVGDLPTPRYNCTCVLLNPNREILVLGGSKYSKSMDIAKLK